MEDRFYELEKLSVLSNNWVGVCGAHHLSKSGDYVTGQDNFKLCIK